MNDSKVVIYGYTKAYLVNPHVEVCLNGMPAGSVKRMGVLTLDVPTGGGELLFRSTMRKRSVRVPSGQVTQLQLSWSSVTGALLAKPVLTPPKLSRAPTSPAPTLNERASYRRAVVRAAR